jgi:hypothetical protein
MPTSRASSVIIVGLLLTATAATITLTVWSLWPVWVQHHAVKQIAVAGRKRDAQRFLHTVALIERLNASAALTEDLLELTDSSEESVRVYSILALPCLRTKSEMVVGKLVGILIHEAESDRVRIAAATALGVLGRQAEPAVPELKRIYSDHGIPMELRRAVSDALLDLQFNGLDIGEFAYLGQLRRINCDAGAREIGERVLESGDYDAWLILIEGVHGQDTRRSADLAN